MFWGSILVRLERWLSGRKRPPAKWVSDASRFSGSNPDLSASLSTSGFKTMRSISPLLLLLVSAISQAQVDALQDYLKIRKSSGITTASGVEALETVFGKRTFEIVGHVKGSIRSGESGTIMVEASNGMPLPIQANPVPDWLIGGNVEARLLIRAERSHETAPIRATLVGAVPEHMIAAWELKNKPKPSTKPVTNPPRNGSNGRPAPLQGQLKPPSNGKVWNLPSSDALPFYRDFIQKQNKRLSFAEADRIARGVIGFSIKYGVDARLVMAMIMVESGFKPNSKSGAGAMGLGQLMPGTARELGVSNAHDSIENLSGMVRLVRSHIDRYSATTDSDYEALVLMLAAYNAGPGAVRKHGGIPPYRETQDYVRKVTSIYRQLCGE